MPFDREGALARAEQALRQGQLEAAIDGYSRVVEDQPHDWITAGTLGDLLVRAGRSDQGAGQYLRIADHYVREGFLPKAAALLRKVLALAPDDESVQLKLADLASRQGLVAEARSWLTAVESLRRSRGDAAGADEIVVRLGSLDPKDVAARVAGAHALAATGDRAGAAARFKTIHADLAALGRRADALDALREAVALDPGDGQARAILARDAIDTGDPEGARVYLDRETAAGEPSLLLTLVELELGAGRLEEARGLMPGVVAAGAAARDGLVALGWRLAAADGAAAFVCIDAAADAAVAESDFEGAAALLQEFVTRAPAQIAALLKLVEVSVDGGLESTMYEAQAQLADAYLASGQPHEARVIAEDLVAREPWERGHIDRFRRALVMLREEEPDRVIAERLSGQTPFLATDAFADVVSQPAGPTPETDASNRAAEQLTLGQSFVEMGMVDEAIEAFEAAARSGSRVFEAGVLLGRLFMDRGDFARALEWLERAAEAPAPTPDAGRALLYSLGGALEHAHERARALAVFLELQADAPDYKDVAARVERLTRAQSAD